MAIQVRKVEYEEIETLRDLYREEARCQIIKDSIIRRGMADAYLINIDGSIASYGGVWNKMEDIGTVMEFYVLPRFRQTASQLFKELLSASEATHISAQTNLPLQLMMLYDFATPESIQTESILFHDAVTTQLACPGVLFRRAQTSDRNFTHHAEPEGDWVLEITSKGQEKIVATGGFLCHYNPPYGDIYMEVEPSARNLGYGSFLVQELKRVCYEAGKRPTARCGPANVASRKTLEKAGLMPCARFLRGSSYPEPPG